MKRSRTIKAGGKKPINSFGREKIRSPSTASPTNKQKKGKKGTWGKKGDVISKEVMTA